MPEVTNQYQRGGVELARLGLWRDSRRSRPAGEWAFVSRAHSDHVGRRREVNLSGPDQLGLPPVW